ncbi:hypothetical protein BW730_04815 [Tessaracoccus aquimaris]|uniref:DUF2568 domain-containing protein n=1 Tax=Tessaracoccus aquimaris TaxID=1332264 RepID=A0A1Q2CLF3_9ACTN|nr:YrdB family protein [Tessaracoccus aquimaris]AQP46944.1 hypothetical protein BW730_04815 [Tessaracoccus aquimaris]
MSARPDGKPDGLDARTVLRGVVLTVRFVLELAMLAGVATVVTRLLPGAWGWVAAAVSVVAVATLWGLLLSPKAKVVLPAWGRLALEAVLFVGTGIALAVLGMPVVGLTGVGVWALHRVALALLEQRRDH